MQQSDEKEDGVSKVANFLGGLGGLVTVTECEPAPERRAVTSNVTKRPKIRQEILKSGDIGAVPKSS
jgi:hypothetical protein